MGVYYFQAEARVAAGSAIQAGTEPDAVAVHTYGCWSTGSTHCHEAAARPAVPPVPSGSIIQFFQTLSQLCM